MASWALVVNQQLCAYSSQLWQKTATVEEVAQAEEQSVAVASKPVATTETEVQETAAVETFDDEVEEKPSKKELSKEDQQAIAEKVNNSSMICLLKWASQ